MPIPEQFPLLARPQQRSRRSTRGGARHIGIPPRHCSVFLDGKPVVRDAADMGHCKGSL